MNANKYAVHAQITKLPVTTIERYFSLYRQQEIARETRNRERAYLIGLDLHRLNKAHPQLRKVLNVSGY